MDSASAQKTEVHYTMSLDGFLRKFCLGNMHLGMDICVGRGQGGITQVLWRRQAIAFIRFSKAQ